MGSSMLDVRSANASAAQDELRLLQKRCAGEREGLHSQAERLKSEAARLLVEEVQPHVSTGRLRDAGISFIGLPQQARWQRLQLAREDMKVKSPLFCSNAKSRPSSQLASASAVVLLSKSATDSSKAVAALPASSDFTTAASSDE